MLRALSSFSAATVLVLQLFVPWYIVIGIGLGCYVIGYIVLFALRREPKETSKLLSPEEVPFPTISAHEQATTAEQNAMPQLSLSEVVNMESTRSAAVIPLSPISEPELPVLSNGSVTTSSS